jgi:hypothetical protein
LELPVDILSEVFQKFVEDDLPEPKNKDSRRPLVSPSCSSDPTVLGQVCSRWRTVATNFPKLWAKIDIYNPKPSQIFLTNLWIQRSRNTPLTLGIRAWEFCDQSSAKIILESFISRLDYWEKIDFAMPPELLGPFYAVVHSPKKPLLLKSVSFWFFYTARHPYIEFAGPYVNAVWKFFYTSPALRQVFWRGFEVNYFPKHAPFHQLTHVCATFKVSVQGVLTFLSNTPLLQDLSITGIDLPSKPPFNIISPPLLLEHLVVLVVGSRLVEISSLFASVTCPHLEGLSVYNTMVFPEDPYLLEMAQFFQRSRCHLKKFYFDLDISEPHHILEIYFSLPAFQSLTSLTLWFPKELLVDEIVQLLTETTENYSHRWLPRLEDLFLGVCRTTDGLLARMISSRWCDNLKPSNSPRPGSLRSVVVFPRPVCGPIDGTFFTELITLYGNNVSCM